MKKIWLGMLAMGLLASCQHVQGWFGEKEATDSTQQLQSESGHAARLVRDESITRENAYSDLFLDSATVEDYISRQKLPADAAGRMRSFYLVRNNQYAWFNSGGVTEQGRGLWSLVESSGAADKEGTAPARMRDRMDSLLSNDSAFLALSNGAIADSTSEGVRDSSIRGVDPKLVETELALTAEYVTLAGEKRGAVTTDNYYLLVPRKKMDALELADSLLHKDADSASWSGNRQYAALRDKLARYYEAAQSGGWQPLAAVPHTRKGASSPAVTQLKKRLAATGDYPAGDTSAVYSDSLRMAVSAVQEQFGQRPTGQVTDSLLRELNVPAQERVAQILVNMNRALWLPQEAADSSRIVINIPTQELLVYGDSAGARRMPVIIGREGTGTIAFNDRISTVVFSPYWNLPESIVRNEVLPAMKKDPRYLERRNMEIVRQNDSIPEVRQRPGKDNALGRVKFLFPNSFDIFLHDTPNKDLFAQKDRALSHGCIRVAQPDSLAAFVLRGQPEWTAQKIAAAMNSGKEQKVAVKNPVPVSITYYTAWASADGKLHFSPDVYGYDRNTASRMFTGSSTVQQGRPA